MCVGSEADKENEESWTKVSPRKNKQQFHTNNQSNNNQSKKKYISLSHFVYFSCLQRQSFSSFLIDLCSSTRSEIHEVVVDFAASWCGPCRVIAPFVAELAKKMPHVTFLKVDVDELKEIAADWGVEAMPTFLFLKDGKKVDKVVGAKKEELQQTIVKHSGTSSSSA